MIRTENHKKVARLQHRCVSAVVRMRKITYLDAPSEVAGEAVGNALAIKHQHRDFRQLPVQSVSSLCYPQINVKIITMAISRRHLSRLIVC